MPLKLKDVRSPLERFEEQPSGAANEPKAGAPASQPKAARRRRGSGGGARPKTTKSPAPRAEPHGSEQSADPDAGAVYATPLAEQGRVTIGATLLPALYERLDELTNELRGKPGPRKSLTRLLIASVHFGVPADVDAAIALALDWQRLRLGLTDDDPYGGARTRAYTLRLYEGQIEVLDEYARALKERHAMTGGRSLLLNAIIHFNGPTSPAEALRLIRALEVEVKGLDRQAA